MTKNGDSDHLRQPEIEDHGVVAFRSSQELGLFAIGRDIDGVPRLAQHAANFFSQNVFVLDEKNAHIKLSTFNFKLLTPLSEL